MANESASKKLQTKRDRRAVEERAKQERARAARRTNLTTIAIALLVIGGAALLILSFRSDTVSGDLPEASDAPTGVVSKEFKDRDHVEGPVEYPDTPPMGGNHAGVWQNCAFYPDPIVPEQGVHSLEHGAVWITFQPELPQDQKDALEQQFSGEDFVLMSPYEGLPSPIVATAWGRQLDVDTADDPKLLQFASFFQVGPQTPEPGAPCTGGVS